MVRAVKSEQDQSECTEQADLRQILICSMPRWTIGVPATPLPLPAGSRIKLQLTQTENASDKPAHHKARAPGSQRGFTLVIAGRGSVTFRGSLAQLIKLTRADDENPRG